MKNTRELLKKMAEANKNEQILANRRSVPLREYKKMQRTEGVDVSYLRNNTREKIMLKEKGQEIGSIDLKTGKTYGIHKNFQKMLKNLGNSLQKDLV